MPTRRTFLAAAAGFAAAAKRSRDELPTPALLERSGIACPWVSGGSTGTYHIDSSIEGVTGLQPGSYMFMDTDYNRIGGADGPVYHDFQNAPTVMATRISRPSKAVAVIDGGFKAFATDRPFRPVPKSLAGVTYTWGGDEHGILTAEQGWIRLELGDRVEFIAPHRDPTMNLYDSIHARKGDMLEAVWAITARGKSQ